MYASVAIGLIQGFVTKLSFLPSESMEPTLTPGERILVYRIAQLWGAPTTGDVIVFDAGDGWDEQEVELTIWQQTRYVFGSLTGIGPSAPRALVKRVIATGGETVSCCDTDGRVVVDGEALTEPYVVFDLPWKPDVLDCSAVPASLGCFGEIDMPNGMLVVLGDNRVSSRDSVSACRGTMAVEGCARFAETARVAGSVTRLRLDD